MTITPRMRRAIRTTLFHMASMRDALGFLKTKLSINVETNQLLEFASILADPADAYRLDDATVDKLLNSINIEPNSEPTV